MDELKYKKNMNILDSILFILKNINSESITIQNIQNIANQLKLKCSKSHDIYWIQAIKKGILQNKILKIENLQEKRLYLGHTYCLQQQ